MWSKALDECLDVIVIKPYFETFTVEMITVNKSI